MGDCDKLLPLINYALEKDLPAINEAIPPLIKKAGLDPTGVIISNSFGPWKVNIGITDVSIGGNYTVTEMKGLSSMQISSIPVTECSGTRASFDATLQPALSLSLPLTAKWSGNLAGSAGPIDINADIRGTVSAKNVSASGTADLTGGASKKEVTLTSLTLTSFTLSYDSPQVTVKGLPSEINSLLDDVIGTLSKAFGNWINGYLDGVVESNLNTKLDGLFPVGFPVPS